MVGMYLLLLLNMNVIMVNSVVFDNIVQSYVERVLCLFHRDMQSDWFDHVIQPPTRAKIADDEETFPVQQRHFLLPKLYIWAPVEHFQLQLRCAKHDAVMTGKQWTNVLNKKIYLIYMKNSTDKECITFYEDLIFSFPSDSQLIRVFLDRLEEMKPLYREEMEMIKATSLSFDHTFKAGKNIGCYRDTDGRYVKQFGFVLLLLNEKNEIVDWRLTKSTGYSEVKDLLRDVKNGNGVNLKSVHVDNCCQSRNQIQEIMGDVPVKLDLFHAVQGVNNVVPKGTEFSKAFCKEFSLVFRQDGDLGDDRMLKTPEPAIISKNMDSFCER